MSRREVISQCSQYNHKTIDRIRQTVLSLGYWYTNDQLLDNTKTKSKEAEKASEKPERKSDSENKKGSKEQMKMMTREDKQVMKEME